MQRRVGAIAVIAALTACSLALPVMAQDNSTNQNPTQNQNNPNASRPRRNRQAANNSPGNTSNTDNTSSSATSTNTTYMQPVAPDFQRNIDHAMQTLDNIVKLLDAIEARKAQAQPPKTG